jgi:RNA polymerase sigma-70 factor (ECF subfamily)
MALIHSLADFFASECIQLRPRLVENSMDQVHPMTGAQPRSRMAQDVIEDIESLLGRCALRDQKALADLYELVSPRLLGLLLRMLRNRALAEEALQDVMIRVWQRADQYVAYRGRAMAWVTSIARYRAIDMLRSHRSQTALDDVPEETLADPGAEAFAEAASSERSRRLLDDCFQRLSAEQQRCLSLAYVDGYSQDEIATVIASPLGTVKSWVRRGLASLKRCMES